MPGYLKAKGVGGGILTASLSNQQQSKSIQKGASSKLANIAFTASSGSAGMAHVAGNTRSESRKVDSNRVASNNRNNPLMQSSASHNTNINSNNNGLAQISGVAGNSSHAGNNSLRTLTAVPNSLQ